MLSIISLKSMSSRFVEVATYSPFVTFVVFLFLELFITEVEGSFLDLNNRSIDLSSFGSDLLDSLLLRHLAENCRIMATTSPSSNQKLHDLQKSISIEFLDIVFIDFEQQGHGLQGRFLFDSRIQ